MAIMDLYGIIDQLIQERNRIDRIIRTLEPRENGPRVSAKSGKAPAKRRGPGRKFMDANGRREVSERMKRYWASRRANETASNPNPVA